MNQSKKNEISHLAIEKLFFDPDNPRIPNDINSRDDEEVISYLLGEANLDDLMKSIVSQGYFEGEPLLVCPKSNDEYIVVEGNRRLGALKLINGFPAPRKQATIELILEELHFEINAAPCIIFDDRSEILSYLGYRHITGIKEWNHLAKARYLKQLHDNLLSKSEYQDVEPKFVYKVLAKNIGSKSNAVENLLRGLKVLDYADNNEIFDSLGKDPNQIHFSLLTTALNNNSISNYVAIDENLKLDTSNIDSKKTHNLLFWLYGDKQSNSVIGESRNIKKLAKVVGSSDALDYLLTHSKDNDALDSAFSIAGGLVEGFEETIFKIDNDLNRLSDILMLVSDDIKEEHINRLENISKRARATLATAKSYYHDDEE